MRNHLIRPLARASVAAAALAFAILLAGTAWAGTSVLTNGNGVAIGGYDPLAYFEGGPALGSADYTHEWNGAIWQFASAEHRDAFAAEPESYAPQFGGWCAYGASEGYAAESDPLNAWTVREDKLYLNWDTEVMKEWRADIPNRVAKANGHWPTIRASLEAEDGQVTIYRKDEEQ